MGHFAAKASEEKRKLKTRTNDFIKTPYIILVQTRFSFLLRDSRR
jgi:hypothetical protein